MPPERRPAARLLGRLESAWAAFQESYAGLPEARLVEPGVAGDWSVKDVLAHVSAWEEEALQHLPVVARGGRPPRYAASGGIDAFNARTAERTRDLPLAEVRRRLDESHRRLIELIRSTPDEQLTGETRFRRRLRLDTYGHYRLHADAIRSWRSRAAPEHPISEPAASSDSPAPRAAGSRRRRRATGRAPAPGSPPAPR